MLAHWNNSPWVDMSLHSDTLLWFRANQYLLFLLNAAYLVEQQQILMLLSLIWPDRKSDSRSTALEANTLTITVQNPREQSYKKGKSDNNNIQMTAHFPDFRTDTSIKRESDVW
jgi:hypothetical protein